MLEKFVKLFSRSPLGVRADQSVSSIFLLFLRQKLVPLEQTILHIAVKLYTLTPQCSRKFHR